MLLLRKEIRKISEGEVAESSTDDWEQAIRLENEMADELLTSGDAQRDDKYTEVYEKVYSSLSAERKREMSEHYRSGALVSAKAFLKIIGPGKNVLDIGCGFGHLTHYVALGGNRVIGIDINRKHVSEAKELYGLQKNVEFRETRGTRLDFPDATFDHVLSTSVFEHLHPKDVSRHLAEIHRVLKSRGKYIFTALTPYMRGDFARHSKDPLQRQKHGFHINERTWTEFRSLLHAHGFHGRTDFLPGRFRHRFPKLLIPVSLKGLIERHLPLKPFVLRVLRLDKVYIVSSITFH